MKNNVIDKIVLWNQKRGLDKRGFDLQKEVSYLYSEILELMGNNSLNHDQLAYEHAQKLFNQRNHNLTDDEIADGFGDIIIYCVGALLKLGYDPNRVLEIINQANEAKSNNTNVLGKIVKPSNFQKPNLSYAKLKKNKYFIHN